MVVTKFELNLPTADIKQCLDFYVNGLLFTKVFEFPEYCTVSFDSILLSFWKQHEERVRAHRGLFSFHFRVRDIHKYFDQLKAAGRVQFEQELELMQPGVWQFNLRDCNAYRLGFAMP